MTQLYYGPKLTIRPLSMVLDQDHKIRTSLTLGHTTAKVIIQEFPNRYKLITIYKYLCWEFLETIYEWKHNLLLIPKILYCRLYDASIKTFLI